jgi:hypothetical protein
MHNSGILSENTLLTHRIPPLLDNNLVELEYMSLNLLCNWDVIKIPLECVIGRKVLIFRFTFGMQFVLFMAKLSVTISGLVSKPE